MKRFLSVASLFILIAGCAGFERKAESVSIAQPETAAFGWFHARFRINWPENAKPAWHLDLLLAREVFMPILEAHGEEVFLWRFHRRAARDAAGHRFSYAFYAAPQTAEKIFAALKRDPMLEALKDAGWILGESYDHPGDLSRPRIADTSDETWSGPLQNSWPYFAMGVSWAWLSWIDGVAREEKGAAPGLSAKIDFYRLLDQAVTERWLKEGGHAFLHHLNALFGYEPVMVGGYRMRF